MMTERLQKDRDTANTANTDAPVCVKTPNQHFIALKIFRWIMRLIVMAIFAWIILYIKTEYSLVDRLRIERIAAKLIVIPIFLFALFSRLLFNLIEKEDKKNTRNDAMIRALKKINYEIWIYISFFIITNFIFSANGQINIPRELRQQKQIINSTH